MQIQAGYLNICVVFLAVIILFWLLSQGRSGRSSNARFCLRFNVFYVGIGSSGRFHAKWILWTFPALHFRISSIFHHILPIYWNAQI